MSSSQHKRLLLIGGVIAGSAIIIAARIAFGQGLQKTNGMNEVKVVQEALRDIHGKIDGNEKPSTEDETIKNLGEKLKQAQPQTQLKQ